MEKNSLLMEGKTEKGPQQQQQLLTQQVQRS